MLQSGSVPGPAASQNAIAIFDLSHDLVATAVVGPLVMTPVGGRPARVIARAPHAPTFASLGDRLTGIPVGHPGLLTMVVLAWCAMMTLGMVRWARTMMTLGMSRWTRTMEWCLAGHWRTTDRDARNRHHSFPTLSGGGFGQQQAGSNQGDRSTQDGFHDMTPFGVKAAPVCQWSAKSGLNPVFR